MRLRARTLRRGTLLPLAFALCGVARTASAQQFPITVDASPLSNTSVVLAPSTLLSETTSQVVSLSVGLHQIFYGSGSPTPTITFEVTPAGTIAYDASLGGILAGEGTSTLSLLGAVVRVDATPLSTTEAALSGSAFTPPDWEVVQTLRLLPGGHTFFYGSGSPTPAVNFVVGADSTISYNPALEGILLGAGTSNLTLAGAPIQVDATPLSTTTGGFGGMGTLDWEVVRTLRLLPGGHAFFYGSGSPTPFVNFVVGVDGKVSYDAALEGVLVGAGTSSVVLAGAAVEVDATALSNTGRSLNGIGFPDPSVWGVPQSLRLLPGGHLFFYGSGSPMPFVNFVVGADGTVSYSPTLEGILRGAGTTSIELAGAEIRIAFDEADTVSLAGYRRILPCDPLALLPGGHFLFLSSGGVNFVISENGTVDYDSALDGQLAGRGTSTLQFRASVGEPFSCSSAPTADAGPDFSVGEGQGVILDGSNSSDPDGNALAYSWVQLPGGTPVSLVGANTAHPSFRAPAVPIGGETLSFELTVTSTGGSSSDTVSVTVVNVNHTPVADAGDDQSVIEGALVMLHGEDSFDTDSDALSYSWSQVSGPLVTLAGADSANPSFSAPLVGPLGAALVFELRVDDGYPMDQPPPGYTLSNVVDQTMVVITDVNNAPVADAGAAQTVDENSLVHLDGSASSDSDGDTLTYSWAQVSGPAVTLLAPTTAMASFTAPFVSSGGAVLAFELSVADGNGGLGTDLVAVLVVNTNDPPQVGAAQPTVGLLWPPNHAMVRVGITGVSDLDNNATITITSVTQDEPTNALGDGDTAVDAVINADGTVLLRAERSGTGDGRVYHIHFTASDAEGTVAGVVVVSVPLSKKGMAIDGGELHDSTL